MIKKLLLFLTVLISQAFFSKSTAQHSVSTLCGTSVQGSPLAGPDGICITPDGTTLYVADYTAHRIKKVIVASGATTNYAGSGVSGYTDGALLSSQFYYPTGIEISSDGNYLFVSDNANCLIRKIDIVNSQVSTIAGVYNAFDFADNPNGLLAKFNQPVDLVMAAGDSVLYISDAENYVIRKMNLNTTAVTTVAGTPMTFGNTDAIGLNAKFRYPRGMCLSNNGQTLYVADAANHKIRKINISNMNVSTLAGTGLQGSADHTVGTMASFYIPQGVAILPNDSLLYVIDTYNNLIRMVNINTTSVTTIAGSTSIPTDHFADNTNGLLAKFYFPVNAVLSLNGDKLYISDQSNYRIRRMNTDVSFPTAITSHLPNSLDLYPNPASNYVSLSLPVSSMNDIEYEIINTAGAVVSSTNISTSVVSTETIQLPLNNLADGIYYIRLKINHEFFYAKLMVLNY
jgi:sugar lactone lactonase YvrE